MRTDQEHRIFIGIDNGVSGSIGAIKITETERKVAFYKTPVFNEQDYVKKKQRINRIDTVKLTVLLSKFKKGVCIVERPMVNPGRWRATVSAIRALEATLIVLEQLGIPMEYMDSRVWQKELLPVGTKGPTDLKKASLEIGCRLFPSMTEGIKKHGDADGLLLAEFARRNR